MAKCKALTESAVKGLRLVNNSILVQYTLLTVCPVKTQPALVSHHSDYSTTRKANLALIPISRL